MKLDYMRTAARSYMIVKDFSFPYEEFELQMLLNNHIPGLLELQVICGNGSFEYWYDVTGMISMELLLGTEAPGREALAGYIRQICDARMMLEKYFLDANDLIYQPSMLYQDKTSGKLQFCCIPGYHSEQENGLKSFMEEILKYADHSDPQAVRCMYDVYEQCTNPDVRMEDLLALVSDPAKEQARPAPGPLPAEDTGSPDRPAPDPDSCRPAGDAGYTDYADLLDHMELSFEEDDFYEKRSGRRGQKQKKEKPLFAVRESGGRQENKYGRKRASGLFKREKPDPGKDGFTEQKPREELWPGYEEVPYTKPREEATVFLEPSRMRACCRLLYCGNGREPDLTLDHFPYTIGKNRQQADGILQANTVSRIHARIHKEDGEYLLEDLDSTNGTCINGTILAPRTPAPLRVNDRVTFGVEEFVLNESYVPAEEAAKETAMVL